MQLMRLGPPGSEIPAVLTAEGTHLDLRPLTSDIDGAFLAGPGLDQARAAVRAGTLPALDAAGLRVGPPVARPSAVLCIGMNYAAHAAETGAAPPERPVLFYKAPNTVVGPDDTVLNPRGATKLDWEVELAVVIGTRVRYLESAERALDHVAGYAISNDVSERYFQIEISGGQWSKGKSCETFNPLGPWLVTADEVADPQALGLRTRVNGAARQDSTTRDMVFTVAELIYQLSQVTVLEPGDIINTGTPQGVALSGRFPYLVPGDTVELEIDGLGRQRQLIAQA
jgi:2-keto-4-pentenoate hydratase/2-oxohepta-3-ene-1,7-dioic acid hydratase in catechol pathway